jgi:hypothetical protein
MELENAAGNLMVVQYQNMRLEERLDQSMPSANSFEDALTSRFSFKFVKDIDNEEATTTYYNISIKATQSEEPAYSLGDRDRNAEFENLIGNMLIARYQMYILKKRLLGECNISYLTSNIAKPASSEFMFETSDSLWLRLYLNLDKARIPSVNIPEVNQQQQPKRKKQQSRPPSRLPSDEYSAALRSLYGSNDNVEDDGGDIAP